MGESQLKRLLISSAVLVGSVFGIGEVVDAAYPPAPCTNKTITITGERAMIDGNTGIKVTGNATCLAGQKLVPYLRFPGGEYFEGTARPNIENNGSFEFFRKTGKKVYVYFKVGDVTSNRIIIAAS